jgi:hypothetical protein
MQQSQNPEHNQQFELSVENERKSVINRAVENIASVVSDQTVAVVDTQPNTSPDKPHLVVASGVVTAQKLRVHEADRAVEQALQEGPEFNWEEWKERHAA